MLRRLIGALTLTAPLSLIAAPASAQQFDIHAPESRRGSFELEVLNGANIGSSRGNPDFLRNAHETKAVTGITDRWTFELGALVEKPDLDDARFARISLENILVVQPAQKNGLGFAWFAATDISTSEATHNALVFGPLIQYNAGRAEVLVNTLLHKSFGRGATPGVDLNYIWRAKYEVKHGFAVGAMGYGVVEELGASPSFNQQDHRIGPALFFDVPMAKGRDLDISLGTFFGVTSAAPEASVMLNFGIPFTKR